MQLVPRDGEAFPVVRVDDEDEGLGLFFPFRTDSNRFEQKVMNRGRGERNKVVKSNREKLGSHLLVIVPPEGADLVLPSYVPDSEVYVLSAFVRLFVCSFVCVV